MHMPSINLYEAEKKRDQKSLTVKISTFTFTASSSVWLNGAFI